MFVLFMPVSFASAAAVMQDVTVGQLLERAERGERKAIKMLAAAGAVIFQGRSLNRRVEITPEINGLMKIISIRVSLLRIAEYTENGFLNKNSFLMWTKKRDPIPACVWLMRAANYPDESGESDKKYAHEIRKRLGNSIEKMTDEQIVACQKGAGNWILGLPDVEDTWATIQSSVLG